MTVKIDGTNGITNDSGYTGDGISFADSTPANTLVTTTGGNVGIGTSSPAKKLHVVSTTLPQFRVDYNGTYYFDISNNGTFNITDPTSSNLYSFQRNGTEQMRLDTSGNLLVGLTSGNGYRGDFLGTTSFGGLNVAGNSAGSYYTMNINELGSGTLETVRINRSGTQVGSIRTTATTTAFITSSDYRLKENIAPMTGALAKVQALKPCTYTWKLDGSAGEGFIAHQLQEIVPGAVFGEKDAVNEDGSIKPQGIDTSFLVATLTAAIQEQQAIITTLTARIEALEAKNT